MYSEVTNSIKISVDPTFMEEQSEPEDFHFVWAYHICIENQGDETVQLLRRHWHITDSQGRIHEVRGEGVVGEQPVLQPGESFEYTSGTPLATTMISTRSFKSWDSRWSLTGSRISAS